ncbi:hypothetical protein BH11PSE2_BH11PSE2_02810 [soil metagenome]
MKITNYVAAIAVGLMCVAGQASAADVASAQVSSVKGSVAVEHAGKITAATSATTLRAGDRLIAANGAAAQIKFADGCVVAVKANAMATVGAQSPCSGNAGLVTSSSPMQLGGLGSFGGALAVFGIGALLLWAYSDSVDSDGEDGLSP